MVAVMFKSDKPLSRSLSAASRIDNARQADRPITKAIQPISIFLPFALVIFRNAFLTMYMGILLSQLQYTESM